MSIDKIVCDDFTGGQVPRLAATDFSERQWANIRGLVMEDPTRLRSQWPCQQIGTESGFDELGAVRGRLVARKPDGTFWWCPYPSSWLPADGTKALTWTRLTAITADPALHILCQVPFRGADAGESVGFEEGLLINGRERSGNAYVVTPDGSSMSVASYPRFPSGSNPFIPPADVACMWGDFLVLGDIRWIATEGEFGSGNNKRHPSHLWFSDPIDIGKWAVLDTEPVAFYDSIGSGQIAVRDMVPLDAGLLVLTHNGAALLRGTPSDHDFEPLRPGTGAARARTAHYWGQIGAACFIDAGGRLWTTNGIEFSHVNVGTGLPTRKDVAVDVVGWLDNLLVAHDDGRLLYLHALETEGVWGELVTPTPGVRQLVVQGGLVNWLDDAGRCWRFSLSEQLDDERGCVDGEPVELRLATRTVERGGGHEKTMWHRVGLRAKGPGTLQTVTVRPGPALDPDQPALEHTVDRQVGHRGELVVRAHGPSKECSADFAFEGDVEVEQVAFWLHAGRGDR